MSRLGRSLKHWVVFTESSYCGKCKTHHFALIQRVLFLKLPMFLERNGKPHHVEATTVESHTWTDRSVLLGFLHFPLAGAFAQLLLGFQRWSWGGGGRMTVVVFIRPAQRGAKQQVADPGFNEGEGRAVRVSSGHHHLRRDDADQRIEERRRSISSTSETRFCPHVSSYFR